MLIFSGRPLVYKTHSKNGNSVRGGVIKFLSHPRLECDWIFWLQSCCTSHYRIDRLNCRVYISNLIRVLKGVWSVQNRWRVLHWNK